jgi:hypothetical protein
MDIIKEIKNWSFLEAATQHSGWLPSNAVVPQDTSPARESLDIQMMDCENGEVLLVWRYKDEEREHDSWCGSIEDAEEMAERVFGIARESWESEAP